MAPIFGRENLITNVIFVNPLLGDHSNITTRPPVLATALMRLAQALLIVACKSKINGQEVNADTSGKLTSRDGRTELCRSVISERSMGNIGDPCN